MLYSEHTKDEHRLRLGNATHREQSRCVVNGEFEEPTVRHQQVALWWTLLLLHVGGAVRINKITP